MSWLKSPLSVWWLSAGIVIVFFSTTYAWYKHSQGSRQDPFIAYQQLQLQGLAKHSIIVLGNSRMKYALLPDKDIQQALAKTSTQPFDFLHMVKSGANFQDFAPLSNTLLAREPRLIILQVELLSTYETSHAFLSMLRFLLLQKLLHPSQTIQSILRQRVVRDQIEVDCHITNPTILKQQMQESLAYYPDHPHLTPEMRNLFQQAQVQRIPILIIAQPHLPTLEKLIAKRYQAWLAQINVELQRFPQVILLHSPPLDATDYCDTGHMNLAGRRIFTQWLLHQLYVAEHRYG